MVETQSASAESEPPPKLEELLRSVPEFGSQALASELTWLSVSIPESGSQASALELAWETICVPSLHLFTVYHIYIA
jgi:hypothetical protein